MLHIAIRITAVITFAIIRIKFVETSIVQVQYTYVINKGAKGLGVKE
jgi:hypothetical protein